MLHLSKATVVRGVIITVDSSLWKRAKQHGKLRGWYPDTPS